MAVRKDGNKYIAECDTCHATVPYLFLGGKPSESHVTMLRGTNGNWRLEHNRTGDRVVCFDCRQKELASKT